MITSDQIDKNACNQTVQTVPYMTPFFNAVLKSGVTISKLECGCNLVVTW